jgi:putative glycosyltransferase (TIGR04348 family)
VKRPTVIIVTPALAAANNGNWQTAQRWARLLRGDYRVHITADWPGLDGERAKQGDIMLALHARRSAASVAAWRQARGAAPLVVVLTGTDLYRDIQTDAHAQHSLTTADRLVVLNQLGAKALPAGLHNKTRVCLQSCPAIATKPKTARHLRALMVGHLRDEKSPQTYFEAARLLHQRPDIHLDHIGDGLDPKLAAQAQSLMHQQPRYRWLGGLPHAATRQRIAKAHVLVHASRMEGGAHVVMEAITSGTPVLASRIDGNVGLLGEGYGGYFDWGDAAGLATLLEAARDSATLLPLLRAQCAAQAPLFAPEREQAQLLSVLQELAT